MEEDYKSLRFVIFPIYSGNSPDIDKFLKTLHQPQIYDNYTQI